MGVAYVYYTKPNEKRSVNRVYRDLSTLISRRSQKKKIPGDQIYIFPCHLSNQEENSICLALFSVTFKEKILCFSYSNGTLTLVTFCLRSFF